MTTMLLALSIIGSLTTPVLIPKPVSESFSGSAPFEFTSKTSLVSDTKASATLVQLMAKAPGLKLGKSGSGNKVVFRMMSDTRKLRPDWYSLKVGPKQVTVEYTSEAGAFYAVQTLRQLLPDVIESPKMVKGVRWTVPGCEISDGPRFGWRGMMLDVSRHFFPIEYIKKTLDRMAFLKMNTFHWHLVDDGGWRIEIKKYPNLTKMGAWRLDTGEVWPGGSWNYGNIQFVGDGSPSPSAKERGLGGEVKRYGGFYTQAQVKEIVKYAADRHITVVPEIEMPGHSLGAVVSYPELLCKNVKPADKPGKSVSNVYCAGNPKTIKFVEEVLDEVMTLFPSQFIHIGADEVLKDYWQKCPDCQARMRSEGLKNEHELQSWFVKHFDTYLGSKGRRLVGWDEILEGGLAPGATVMSWRGIDGGIAAAKAGRDVVMSPTSHCYFDYSYKAIDSEKVYGWNPVPSELSAEQARHVLGGQYNVWTEWIADTKRCDELQFPRALAMAEVLWSPAEGRDFKDYSDREAKMLGRLGLMGVNVHIPAPTVQYSSIFMKSGETLRADNPKGVPFTLRYTIDGKTPTVKSAAYVNGVKVDRECTVTFAYVSPNGMTGDVTRVDCRVVKDLQTGKLEQGLTGSRFHLKETTSSLADLKLIQPVSTFKTTYPMESDRPRPVTFAVTWDGYIRIPVTGAYTFSLTSDDGSRLWLNDALVVDNDGPHGAVEKSGTAWLPDGLYGFHLQWFDQGGANSFQIAVKTPGGKKAGLDSSWLWRPN